MAQIGVPYVWAGSDVAVDGGFDCSGLVMAAWAQAGVSLWHQSAWQFRQTARVSLQDLQPGDLLFFGWPIHHVGMYIGDGRMVEAPQTGQLVRTSPYRRKSLVAAGRIRS